MNDNLHYIELEIEFNHNLQLLQDALGVTYSPNYITDYDVVKLIIEHFETLPVRRAVSIINKIINSNPFGEDFAEWRKEYVKRKLNLDHDAGEDCTQYNGVDAYERAVNEIKEFIKCEEERIK